MKQPLRNDLARLLLRLILGVVFVYHGSGKLFGLFGGGGIEGTASYMESIGLPGGTVMAVLAGAAEFFGGLALIVGFAVPLAAVPLVITMLVASFVAHSGFSAQSGGMEYSLTLAVATAAAGLLGAGRFALFGPSKN